MLVVLGCAFRDAFTGARNLRVKILVAMVKLGSLRLRPRTLWFLSGLAHAP